MLLALVLHLWTTLNFHATSATATTNTYTKHAYAPILRIYKTILRGNTFLQKLVYIKVLEWRLYYMMHRGGVMKDEETILC